MPNAGDPTIAAIVVAAGRGERFGAPKHELRLGGVALWQRSVNTLAEAGIDEIIVVGPVPGGIPGGDRRRDSVREGLHAVTSAPGWVLIHDAARPLVTVRLVRRIMDALGKTHTDAVIPAVPVTDTVKRVEGDAVVATVDRSELVTVQTPQAFRYSVLLDAHDRVEGDATDDAVLVERVGGSVAWIPGDPRNIKITYPEDLIVAQALAEEEQQ